MKDKYKIRIWDESEQKPVFKAKGNKLNIEKEIKQFFNFK